MSFTIAHKSHRILVLDADVVPALAVCRSLGKSGCLVDVASSADNPVTACSRHVYNCYQYPDPLACQEQFLAWMQGHLDIQRYDLVIPVTERTLVPLSANRDRYPHTRFAMANRECLDKVLDKRDTFELALELGVPAPSSVYLDSLEQLGLYLRDLTYPVVVKPSRSVSPFGGGYRRHSVSYANTEGELWSQCRERLRDSPVILQSYFSGIGAGIELIALNGEIHYPFQHVRLHELPLSGGGSSFRVSTEIDPGLLAATRKLIAALSWTGVAMVEFKWRPETGEFCLMEINGRLWGSLPLALAAGADFPGMLVELSLTGDLGAYPDYRRGVYCRNLSRDLVWHERVVRQRRTVSERNSDVDYPRSALPRLPSSSEILRDLARVFSPAHHFDTQSLSDPLPGLVEIKRLAETYASRLRGVVSEKLLFWHQCLLWNNGTVRERLREASSVLFVCYGNINRSSLAEFLMKSMQSAGCPRQIKSAGFHDEESRPVDERMKQIAGSRGLDLSASRSTRITADLVAGSDIIFVMEKSHRDRLLKEYAAKGDRVFLLGPGCRDGGAATGEISDPYNQSEELYRKCFTQISQAVGYLTSTVLLRHGG